MTASFTDKGEVRAAGGVVWRPAAGSEGEVEVLLVHRPKYDDWTLPKGKAEEGEPDEEAALREVVEETGLRCRLGDELPSVRYVDHLGRPKVVRFWVMEVAAGEFVPTAEVDAVAWCRPGPARALLSYARDGDVLDAFERGRPVPA
ncbi:MAG TPA: NUDIX hydrolase [Acidimicrobiales bacterium]|nr:NUDIX hydrolase [Acidimicrobiales bacterium]